MPPPTSTRRCARGSRLSPRSRTGRSRRMPSRRAYSTARARADANSGASPRTRWRRSFARADTSPTARGRPAIGVEGQPVTTSSGAFTPSLELRSSPSVEVPASTKLNVPLPVTREVTSNSTHAPPGTLALSLVGGLVRAGRVDHVMPPAPPPVQEFVVEYQARPFVVALVAHRRSLALCSGLTDRAITEN